MCGYRATGVAFAYLTAVYLQYLALPIRNVLFGEFFHCPSDEQVLQCQQWPL